MRCPKCGHDNDEDAEFCVNCGANLGKKISRHQFAKQIFDNCYNCFTGRYVFVGWLHAPESFNKC